jgi:DNA-binding beta-propeller fold protein YncE
LGHAGARRVSFHRRRAQGTAGIARDIEGNAWVANNAPGGNSISEILTATDDHPTGMPLSPPGGFSGAGLDRPYGIAVDDNGNVWVTNQAGNSVTVFIGVARAAFLFYRE